MRQPLQSRVGPDLYADTFANPAGMAVYGAKARALVTRARDSLA
ncbi:hypothetical protein [Streptomyces sp. MST-110588]|nr:hypothetical protein [Streptomyces sp. MST-110588]